jgi:hypothetical protein
MKAQGKTNRRSMKHILGAQNDSFSDGDAMCKSYESSKLKGCRRKLILSDEDDDSLDGMEKDSLMGSEEHELALQNSDGKSKKQNLKACNDYLRYEVITSQLLECSKPKVCRRKVILSVEDDDWIEVDISFINVQNLKVHNDSFGDGVTMCKSYESSKTNGCRRKLILSDEDDDFLGDMVKDSLMGSEEHELALQNANGESMKQILKAHNDYLRYDVTTSQLLECSKPKVYRRKLILPVEDDNLIEDGISFNNEIDISTSIF